MHNLTCKQIGYIFKVSETPILRILKENSVFVKSSNNSKKFSNNEQNIILEKYKNGESASSIGLCFKCSESAIRNVLISNGIKIENKKLFKRIYSRNSNVFNVIDNEVKAYFLGIIASDGYIVENHTVGLCLKSVDIETIEKFKQFLETDCPIRYIKKTDAYELRIRDKILVKNLINKGIFPNKSKTLDCEEIAKYIPINLVNHFIRGYFDGDGCVSYDKFNENLIFQITATEKSCIYFESILNINNKILKDSRHDTVYTIRTADSIKVRKIAEFMYSNSKIYMKRKYEKFKKYKML